MGLNNYMLFKSRKSLLLLGGLLAVIASFLGLFWLTLILQIVLIVRYVLMPSGMVSLLARTTVALFIFYAVFQLAAAIQFIIIPQSDFKALAALSALLIVLIALMLPSTARQQRVILEPKDWYAMIATACFFIPVFTVGLLAPAEVLTKIGGIQGLDGVNHFGIIAELSHWQHFKYEPGFYYPGGFHISTAYIQNSFGIVNQNLSWIEMARLYILQYAVFGAVMLYVLARLSFALIGLLLRQHKRIPSTAYATGALIISLSVTALYFSGFIYHGFLSYFYICAAMVVGMLYLFDAVFDKGVDRVKINGLVLFSLISLGASMSWPLWVPAIFLTTAAFVVGLKLTGRSLYTRLGLLIITSALHLIPIYFQLRFSMGDSAQGLNLTGGLRIFHYGSVLLGVVTLAYFFWRWITTNDSVSRIVTLSILPIAILVLPIIWIQYFVVGEVRYYGIKTSFYFEIISVVLLASLVAAGVSSLTIVRGWLMAVPAAVFISFSCFVLFMSLSGNPFLDVRLLLRNISDEPTPAFFEEDVNELSAVGKAGKMTEYSVISLHVSEEGKLYTHMQSYYWAGMMEYDGSPQSRSRMAYCNGAIYGNLFKQDFSDTAQGELIERIRQCISLAEEYGKTYSIITDDNSESKIRSLFGSKINLI